MVNKAPDSSVGFDTSYAWAATFSMTILNLWNPTHTGIAGAAEAAATGIHAIPLPECRDVRLDLVRGLAIWFIFLDDIPHNAVNWITLRNYGFSGAGDLFICVCGYVAAVVYANMIVGRGSVGAAARIVR